MTIRDDFGLEGVHADDFPQDCSQQVPIQKIQSFHCSETQQILPHKIPSKTELGNQPQKIDSLA
jgi:hypothetical protein